MSDDRRVPTAAAADRPTFKIFSGGNPIPPEYQIQSISIQRDINRVSGAVIIIQDGSASNEDFPVSNADEFVPGSEIEIQAGYHSQEETVFKGVVIKIGVRSYEKRPSVFQIECRDKSVKLTIGRKNKYFYESTDSDILEEIIQGAGLTPDVKTTNTTHQQMIQYNCSDWDFLITRADTNGQLVFTEDGTLRIAAPDLGQQPQQTLLFGGNILDFEAEIDARWQYSNVHSMAWDAANQEMLDMEASPPGGTLPGNINSDDLAGVIGLDSYDLRHAGQIKDTELQAQADAQLLKSRLAKVRGRIRIQGVSTIKPGQIVELKGAGDRFNGPVFVSGIRHDITDKNWETHLILGLSPNWFIKEHDDVGSFPASGLLPNVNGLHIGLVTALEGDPEGEDRIQVRIPVIDPQEEGAWARIASLDAGENRGFVFRPEIGDEVVLGFLDDDPRNPIVLGMLHSSAKPAPIPAADDNHKKGLVTRSEMKVSFDDEVKSIIIETPKGNKMTLSEEAGGITIEDENGNKIVMDANGISIESAGDVKISAGGDAKVEGTNITQSASASFKAEGSGGAELSTSATAVLKGSIVQIN